MYETSVTAGAIVAEATTWAGQVDGLVVIIVGVGFALGLAAWVIRKVRMRSR